MWFCHVLESLHVYESWHFITLGLEMKEVDIFMHVFFFFSRWLCIKNDYNYVEDKLHMKSKVSIVLDELTIIYAHLLFLQMWCAIVLYCLILIFNLVVMNLTSHGFFQKGFTFQKTKHFVVSYFNFYHHIWFLLHTFLATWWKDC